MSQRDGLMMIGQIAAVPAEIIHCDTKLIP